MTFPGSLPYSSTIQRHFPLLNKGVQTQSAELIELVRTGQSMGVSLFLQVASLWNYPFMGLYMNQMHPNIAAMCFN